MSVGMRGLYFKVVNFISLVQQSWQYWHFYIAKSLWKNPFLTRQHSSRIRTTCLESVRVSVSVATTRCCSQWGPQVWCLGGYTVRSNAPWVMVTWGPSVQTDTQLWKHYLAATSLACGNKKFMNFPPFLIYQVSYINRWLQTFTSLCISLLFK